MLGWASPRHALQERHVVVLVLKYRVLVGLQVQGRILLS